MKYMELKKIPNIDLLLLSYLDVVTINNEIYKISHFPDFDMTPYGRENLTNYAFDDYWDFSSKYHSVIHVSVGDVYIFHYDDICRISKSYNIPYEKYDQISILEKAIGKNKKLFSEEGMEPDFDGFSFHDLKVNYTDNLNKRILFNGGISAASDTVTDCDWDLFTELSIIGINRDVDTYPIHLQLLAEGRNLYSINSFKLAFFVIYSSLENYLNLKTNGENEEIRLKEKINIAFKNIFSNLSKHNIYNSIISSLTPFTEKRHIIAHGRENIKITSVDCMNIMIFTCIVIVSLENKFDSFAKLKSSLQL